MKLLDLPPEVLLCITDQLDHARDISSLVSTTRFTSHIFQDALLRFAARQQSCPALHYAAKENKRSTAAALLRYGAKINAPLKTYTPLMIAAAYGSASVLDLFLAQADLDANAKNLNGETALWCAAYAGNRHAVIRLLQCKDIQVESVDTWNRMTPFAAAILNGHIDIARDLLGTGQINLNARDKNSQTPVYHAIKSHDHDALSLLLFNREVNIHIQDHLNRTPFWYAVKYSNLLAAQFLLSRGANPNRPDMDRIAPLNVAILKGDVPMLMFLLDRQEVDVSPRLDPGVLGVFCEAQPPVCLAAYVGSKQVLKLLLCRGADVNAVDSLGSPPLHLAIRKIDLAMIKLLLNCRFLDVNKRTRDELQFTALHEAVRGGRLSIVNLLLSKDDVHINARDSSGRTPLWWATKNNHTFIAKRLLAENGLDINAASDGGSTPLHHAINLGNRLIALSLLAEDKLNPNVPNKDGITPLGCAVLNGDKDMVDLLLTRKDIQVNLGGVQSHSPFALAVSGGHYGVLLRLLRYTRGAGLMAF